MAQFHIAHINEQGQDIIIIPLDWTAVQTLSQDQREGLRLGLELCARNAGLAGTVCLVWEVGVDFYSYAPALWQAFFDGLNMPMVVDMLNKTLTCTAAANA